MEYTSRVLMLLLFLALAWFISPWWLIAAFFAAVGGLIPGSVIGALTAAILFPGWGLIAFIAPLVFLNNDKDY